MQEKKEVSIFKGYFTQNWIFSLYLLTIIPVKGWVKFFSPVSQEKGTAVISQTTEVNGEQFSSLFC